MGHAPLPFWQEVLAYLLAISVAAPLSALIAHLASNVVAGFKTRYLNVLFSTIVGMLCAAIIGSLLMSLLRVTERATSFGIRIIVGWSILSICHLIIVRGPNQEKLSRPRALALTATQAIGGITVIGIAGLVIGFFLRK